MQMVIGLKSTSKITVDYIKTLEIRQVLSLILVVNSGSALNLSEVEPYVDAILYAWYLGEQKM